MTEVCCATSVATEDRSHDRGVLDMGGSDNVSCVLVTGEEQAHDRKILSGDTYCRK
jgi:hypothetical protein